MRDQNYQDAFNMISNHQFKDGVDRLRPILEGDTRDDTYYKSLKLYADVIGLMTKNDLFLAIDMYQTIINECEDDDLYASAQIAQLESQLRISIHFMESYENTIDVIQTDDDFTINALKRLDDMREKYIVSRAENIYKNRM